MAKDQNQPETTQPAAVLWSVSMVVGPHPGVIIAAANKEDASAEYRKRYRLADDVELWIGRVPQ